jgi:hypothetical protein
MIAPAISMWLLGRNKHKKNKATLLFGIIYGFIVEIIALVGTLLALFLPANVMAIVIPLIYFISMWGVAEIFSFNGFTIAVIGMFLWYIVGQLSFLLVAAISATLILLSLLNVLWEEIEKNAGG